MHNMGNYRGQVKAEDRIGVLLGRLNWGMRYHIDKWREKGEKYTPAAIVIGAPPHVTYAAVTRIPNDQCEYDVAGGLIGQPIELVKCVTQDLLVPADAEIVIEGTRAERRGRDGRRLRRIPRLHGAARLQLLHGRDRDHHAEEADLSRRSSARCRRAKARRCATSAAPRLACACCKAAGIDNVMQVEYLECAGSNAIAVVKMKKPATRRRQERAANPGRKIHGQDARGGR